jgi:hypothetical protein
MSFPHRSNKKSSPPTSPRKNPNNSHAHFHAAPPQIFLWNHPTSGVLMNAAFFTPTGVPMPNREWLPRIAIPAAILLFLVIGLSNAPEQTRSTLGQAAVKTYHITWAIIIQVMPVLLLAALVVGTRGKSWLIYAALALFGMHLVNSIILNTVGTESIVHALPSWLIEYGYTPLLRISAAGTILVLIWIPNLRSGRTVQIVMSIILGIFIFFPRSFSNPATSTRETVLAVLTALIGLATLVTLIVLAWHSAFRHAHPNNPPSDAAQSIALTCPRCTTPQSIPIPHGQCTHCKLQFFISLDEGRCQCGYPLRGLTTNKCPECGTELPTTQPPLPA